MVGLKVTVTVAQQTDDLYPREQGAEKLGSSGEIGDTVGSAREQMRVSFAPGLIGI
jgi:hypothetical protein